MTDHWDMWDTVERNSRERLMWLLMVVSSGQLKLRKIHKFTCIIHLLVNQNAEGKRNQDKVSSNLFLFLVFPPSAWSTDCLLSLVFFGSSSCIRMKSLLSL